MSEKKALNPLIPILLIPILGFILLNLTFLFAAGFRIGIYLITNRLVNEPIEWIPLVSHTLTFLIILTISFFILRSKRVTDLIKSIFSVIPIAVLLVYTGIFLYSYPILVYLISGLVVLGTSFYLYKQKKSWMYYYALGLVSIALLIMMILGIDI